MKKKKNRHFFYASYGFDFRHGKSPTLARYILHFSFLREIFEKKNMTPGFSLVCMIFRIVYMGPFRALYLPFFMESKNYFYIFVTS